MGEQTTESFQRGTWTTEDAKELLSRPFNDLLFHAQTVHRQHFDPNAVQPSALLSIKTGGCPEDCKYCPQSARYNTGLGREPLMDKDTVLQAARRAKKAGATRFCMGAAWRSPKNRDLENVTEMTKAVRALGLETCATLGMLSESQAIVLSEAGLDYYNHNLDTSAEFYGAIITTRTYQDRLDTLENVRNAGIKVCCGGIVGLGESRRDRASMLTTMANMPEPPQSVPINQLIPVEGTPLEDAQAPDPLEFIRTIAAARIMMPSSYVRLSAGRTEMSDEHQALCFLAGANSIFYGEQLLTTGNPDTENDQALFERLGIRFEGDKELRPRDSRSMPHRNVTTA